jgi:hypothetical protein
MGIEKSKGRAYSSLILNKIMKKLVSSMVIGAISFSSIAVATPTFAKSEKKDNKKIEIEHRSENSNRTLPSGNSFTTLSNSGNTIRILENKNKVQIKEEGKGKKLLKPMNLKFNLNDDQDEFKLSIPKGTNASSAMAFVDSVKKAHTDYLAAIRSARQAFLAAILQARNIFLNGGTTTTTNTVPTIISVSANPSTVSGTTTTLSAIATDTAGESTLNYTWSVISKPSTAANPVFSVNGTNAAKTTGVTFSGAGAYQFGLVVTDQGSLTASSTISVNVNQILSSVTISPASISLQSGSSTQFNAAAADQFGATQSSGFTWSVAEILGGLVNSSGLYTAPSATGTFHVITTSNVDTSKKATSTVTVTQ